MKPRMIRTPLGLGVLVVLFGGGPAAGQPAYFDAVGYTALQNRLGAATPTGAGAVVSQIEALESVNAYRPDTNPATFPGKTFADMSGGGGVSGHATAVGQTFYGDQSIAPGITQINTYRVDGGGGAGDWIGPAYLRAGTTAAPLADTGRVQNHSYVGTTSGAAELLRRLDFAVRRDNVVAAVAVNNGVGAIPDLQANGFNTIAVGLSNGNSSVGPTTADGAGRSKPDIVAPLGETSFATPVVAAAAALLVQTAAAKSVPAEAAAAGRVETIKAALLSGASKTGLAQPWTRTDNGSFVEPLDRRFGAGQVNIDASHRILSAPQQNGAYAVLDDRTGWDFGTLAAVGANRRYFFEVPADAAGATVSATLNWLRRIPQVDPGVFSTETATLSDLELRLFEADGQFALGTLVDSSLSPVDNVQHLTAALAPGRRYALEVTLAGLPGGQLNEDYGFAFHTTVTPVPEPAGLMAVGLAAAGVWARRRGMGSRPTQKNGRPSNPPHDRGDGPALSVGTGPESGRPGAG